MHASQYSFQFRALGTKINIYPMFYYLGTSYESDTSIKFEGGSLDWESEALVPFYRVER